MHPYDVRVDHLPPEGATFDVRLDAAAATALLRERGLSEPLEARELSARIRVIPGGNDVFVLGELQGAVVGPCSRCLETCEQPLGGEFHLTFVHGNVPGEGGEMELHREDMDLELLQGDSIDLDAVVAEQLFLQLPTRSVCSEECRGLCPVCGGNRNDILCECEDSSPDPRFAALAALR
ncbi:MAG TPA: DUF177 domain-containing protein [Deferrisomatales bacterium]|nr:DUF177 domain-containing protein [Deferrisomatales bacterium]